MPRTSRGHSQEQVQRAWREARNTRGEKGREDSRLQGRDNREKWEKGPRAGEIEAGSKEIEAENIRCENVVASVTFRNTEFDLEDLRKRSMGSISQAASPEYLTLWKEQKQPFYSLDPVRRTA